MDEGDEPRPLRPAARRHDLTGVWICGLVGGLAGCGDDLTEPRPYFTWTDPPVALGAYKLDGLPPDYPGMLENVDHAAESGEVVLFYGHNPPVGTSYEMIEALLSRAQARHVAALSFADLLAASPQPGVCLSFDDTEVEAWHALLPLLDQYGAHVSFFVTEYDQLTEEQHLELHDLYDHGHSVEAHGVHHLYANDYIPKQGLEAYIQDEVLPSIEVLRADGFAPVAYAHPGGGYTPELNDALGEYIPFTRATSGRPR